MDTGPIIRMEKTNKLGEFSKNVEPGVWMAWLDFCYYHRVMNDEIDEMIVPDKGIMCQCGRSVESYPHWPPSTLTEAFDMLETQMQDDNTNHRYLATWWYEYVGRSKLSCNSDSIIEDIWKTSEICQTILGLCPVISKDMMIEDFGGLDLGKDKCKCRGRLDGEVCETCFRFNGETTCQHGHDEDCFFFVDIGNPDWLQAILDQGQ
ncbi:hypothetical protein V8E54_001699 [Elaphomyces granulatus]